MQAGLNKAMAKGVGWMVLLRFSERAVGFISTLILVRLLMPSDFGLIAMATSIVALLELLTAFSFDMALIHNQAAEDHHYHTAWTLNVLLGAISTVLLVLIAPWVSAFYEEPALYWVVIALSPLLLLRGLSNIGIVAFRKDMQFHREFHYRIIKRLLSFLVTISLALYWRSYWALIVGMMSDALIGCVLSYLLHPFRPRPSLAGWRNLFGFSVWVLLNSILAFLRLRSTDFILGKVAGTHSLGLYSVSYEVATMPTAELVAPINRAVFPAFSKMTKDLAELRESYLHVAAGVLLLALPAGIGMAAISDILVPVVLGEKWLDAIPVIQLIAVNGAIISFTANIMPVFMATGDMRISVVMSLVNVLVFIALVWLWGREEGALGAAKAWLVATVLTHPMPIVYMLVRLKIPLLTYVGTVWRPVAASALMYFVTRSWIDAFAWSGTALEQIVFLLSAVAVGLVSYAVSELSLWWLQGKPPGSEDIVLRKILPHVLTRLRRH
ncbi:MAG: lipopolysaccharide biosynthesis protein [Gammaproteobacteria bacterium]|nr:lipopolysaccharide biosynthesis protein [Gammaproteobacteria bacterium]MCP5136731.1 lipopolysaccharide biosynthesis protein [Gammaproteobacteria bacterium]